MVVAVLIAVLIVGVAGWAVIVALEFGWVGLVAARGLAGLGSFARLMALVLSAARTLV